MGKPRPIGVDDERRMAWIDGRGSQFEARLAKLAGMIPAPTRQFAENIAALIWTPASAEVLKAMLDEARRDPGPEGARRAIESIRQVWGDCVVEEEEPNKGGRGRLEEAALFDVWLNFNVALVKARHLDRNVTKEAVEKAFVKKGGQKIKLTSTAQLRKMLHRVEHGDAKRKLKPVPEGAREAMLEDRLRKNPRG
jgi:hypothetical protein